VFNRFLTAAVKYIAALGMAAVVFQKRSLPRGIARSYCKGGGTGKSPKIAAEHP
jgi:hypothetical protein